MADSIFNIGNAEGQIKNLDDHLGKLYGSDAVAFSAWSNSGSQQTIQLDTNYAYDMIICVSSDISVDVSNITVTSSVGNIRLSKNTKAFLYPSGTVTIPEYLNSGFVIAFRHKRIS